MARCLGEHWPCDHAEKHATAAKLGWFRRLHGLRLGKGDHVALETLGFKSAHTDPSHKGLVRFKERGKWFELPRSAFQEIVRAAKDEARQNKTEAQIHDAEERALRVWRKGEHAAVIRRIKQIGGIRPDRIPSGSSAKKPPNYSEWKNLPKQVRVSNVNKGQALDDVAATIAEEFPELRIERGDDLKRYLEEESVHRTNQAYRLKKQPKEEPAPAPAPKKLEPDTFQYVATQKANGKWIVSRRYKSGKITQEPGEFSKNPLPGRSRMGKEAKAPPPGALFGGEHERRQTYGEGLF